jgi:hypothetical protein
MPEPLTLMQVVDTLDEIAPQLKFIALGIEALYPRDTRASAPGRLRPCCACKADCWRWPRSGVTGRGRTPRPGRIDA